MIGIDERYWPLVVFRFSGEVTMDQLETYLKRQDEFQARNKKTVSLVLTDNLKMWEPRVLRRQAEWMKANAQHLKDNALGVALVISSPVVRGMLKAILWMQPMPQPHIVCATVEEGLAWLRARCRDARALIDIPERLS